MTSLLIVDDERDILEGLKTTIKWKMIGINTVFTAGNGLDAVQLLESMSVDIVVTDVRMPGMDGIELTKSIKNKSPKTKVIILSGYSEFEYAKSAIEYGVDCYLLKPVNIRELLEAVHKTKQAIIKRDIEEEKNEQIIKEFQILQEKFLLDIITKRKNDRDTILEGFKKYQINTQTKEYVLINIRIWPVYTGSEHKLDGKKFRAYLKAAINLHDEQSFLLEDPTEGYYLIYQIGCMGKELFLGLTEFKERVEGNYSLELKIGISGSFHSLYDLGDACDQVRIVLKSTFTDESRDIFSYPADCVNVMDTGIHSLKQMISEMYKNEEMLKIDSMDRFYNRISLQKLADEEAIKDLSKSILDLILQSCLEKNIYSLVYERSLSLQLYIKACKRFSHLHAAMQEFLLFVRELEQGQKMDSRIRMICEVKEYIKNNYSKELDVSEVSIIIKRSPNYLSHLFSETCGETFSEYLNRVRIEKARELLKNTDFTLYRIAKEVGYNDERYFIRMFKRISGSTPTQYRNLMNR